MTFLFTFLTANLLVLLFPLKTFAQCPVCIVTVGGGMLLAKKLGIDDLLVAVWISALNTVISYWLAPKIKIKFLNNPFLLSLLLLVTTLAYFFYTQELFVAGNTVLGLDKILLGSLLGFFSIITGNYLYQKVKDNNGGKTIFPYAKVVFPFTLTLIVTLLFKFAFAL